MQEPRNDPYTAYLPQAEPDRQALGYAWHTAMGLQEVDGLKPSAYLREKAQENIDGRITLPEAQGLIERYYQETAERVDAGEREADLVSARIAGLLSEEAFTFSVPQYLGIHARLFAGLYPHAGKLREVNLTKAEWVLDGATVQYGSAPSLEAMLVYDIETERAYSYPLGNTPAMIPHLAMFVSRLWQIHAFQEGNTRTTAVFFIKYLRMLGLDVTNDIFAENAWYFRNALVRANYSNYPKGIRETTEYVELFLRNLLLGAHNELKNRRLHIRWDEAAQALSPLP